MDGSGRTRAVLEWPNTIRRMSVLFKMSEWIEWRCRRRLVLSSFALIIWALPSAALDLSKAVVVVPSNMSGPERKAVTMLLEEVDKRTQIRWECAASWPVTPAPVILVGPVAEMRSFAAEIGEDLAN